MGRSTDEQVAALCESITHGWNRKQNTLAVFCDFSAAYDRVQHHRLFAKLGEMGCPAQMWRWLRAFVMNRRWKCRWKICISSEYIVPQGLPQGETLSPGLWLAYVADLAVAVKETDSSIALSMFADDVVIWSTLDTLEDCRSIDSEHTARRTTSR